MRGGKWGWGRAGEQLFTRWDERIWVFKNQTSTYRVVFSLDADCGDLKQWRSHQPKHWGFSGS